MTTPIVALDFARLDEAIAFVDSLGDACDFYKVGSELFTVSGPRVVSELRTRGKRIFLDLKLHDIPNTVDAAVTAATRLAEGQGVDLLTVHATGGEAMIRAAVAGGAGGVAARCRILCVTVLTSLGSRDLSTVWGGPSRDVEQEVVRLAGLAAECGAFGVVCGGSELVAVHAALGERLRILVPGIRFAGGAANDQQRIITPGEAARLGASFIVLGRAVTKASDPARAMQRAREEIAAAGASAPATD